MSSAPFERVASQLDFPKEESQILEFWRSAKIFERTLEARKGAPSFVFYEGPPTANGMPHNGHVLTRAMKDIFPRYKTMQGYLVERKAGWDTHGLPVEVEVEKDLHIHGKAAIEAYGVEPFVRRCIDSVFRYQSEWERLTERIAFWVDTQDAYVTYHKSYVESVWWALSELFRRGLLYEGHKVVWWWAQGGTALSSAEVGQGYKQVDDPSCFVRFPLVARAGDKPLDASLTGAALLAWTTTPWTLPSNMFAAVNPKFRYVVLDVREGANAGKYVVAKGLVESVRGKICKDAKDVAIVAEYAGSDLVGLGYAPPFDYFAAQATSEVYRVIGADFVLEDATGIVHTAPAFGEDDHSAYRRLLAQSPDLPLFCAIGADGKFLAEFGPYAGRWVKDCDKDLMADLKARGLLVFSEVYRHDYPFCWRADNDPLIQFARPAWYIRTTALIDRAIAQNRDINWLPPHVRDGRFGDFLANNVDWALSRERYWGTPLNVWRNDVTGKLEMPASVAEIEAKNPEAFAHFYAAKKADPTLSDHLIVHKPWIDAVTYENPGEPGTYRRVPEVIDCWFDSGCMPFAQWGFPHVGQEAFKRNFPADFISEAIDQTRGWFYSLLMVSTLLFDEETQKKYGLSVPAPHPYRTCVVLGHITDKDGKKESKSKGNYVTPDVIYDAVRMDFAVWDPKQTPGFEQEAPGTVFIAKEDIEGLDLAEGVTVNLRHPERLEAFHPVVLRAGKKLPRRVMVVAQADRAALGVTPATDRGVKPADVPTRLPAAERVRLCDDQTPAPGADAFRWFFFAASPPWNTTRNSLANVRALQKETLIKLRNVYSFFVIYANIDGFVPDLAASEAREAGQPRTAGARDAEIDRWIRSELSATVTKVTEALDAFDAFTATGHLTDFVESLSNWYVRRCRDRFWRPGQDPDKLAAYQTLYDCLVTAAKLFAPFTPYASEAMYQNLVVRPAAATTATGPISVHASVHLATWPKSNAHERDVALEQRMRVVRDLVSAGLSVRTQQKIRVRQPLAAAHLVLPRADLQATLAPYAPLIQEELNVEQVLWARAEGFVSYKPKPNFRTLGQRGLGKEAQLLKKRMADLPESEATALVTELLEKGQVTMEGVLLAIEDVELALDTKPGLAAAGGRGGVVVLDTRIDDRLKDRGLFREILSRVQNARKDAGLDFVDRIELEIFGSERVVRVVEGERDMLMAEALVTTLTTHLAPDLQAAPDAPPKSAQTHLQTHVQTRVQTRVQVDGETLDLAFQRAART